MTVEPTVRHLVLCLIAVFVLGGTLASPAQTSEQRWDSQALGTPLLRDPIWVYNNWSSYDELSDNIPLTEALAMRELDELLRLRKDGVHFDYYMMDAFWFDPDGGYRTWRKPNWPNGPDAWIEKCRDNGIMPGLWFSTNTLVKINAAPAWQNSLTSKKGSMSFSEGGFLSDFMDVLQYWYGRGIRMFKFDFVDFNAATPDTEKKFTPEQIREKNESSFREALKGFRQKHPDIVLEAFNGFGGDVESTGGPFPFRNPVDLRWLEAFDALYSGDPRPSDVPEMNFWRSADIYSDHMVRRYEQSFLPLERIDSTAFMVGKTGTIYYRKTNAWKGMMLLTAARGGWINTIHGNLELLTEEDARWFAKTQDIYLHFEEFGQAKTWGGIPGNIEPYGFTSFDDRGSIYTVVNPGQEIRAIEMPLVTRTQSPLRDGRILFRDAGFQPVVEGSRVRLGPGEMVAVGFGAYASPHYDLGVQDDVVIPREIHPLNADFRETAHNTISATIMVPKSSDVRILFQQLGDDGRPRRSWPGGPPSGKSVATVLKITAAQNGRAIPITIDYDRVIWSGLSWGAGEIKNADLDLTQPLTITCSSEEKDNVKLVGKTYEVQY